MLKLTVKKVERMIELPADDWEGNCYGIAKKMLDRGVVKGNLRYGHWTGKIHQNSSFNKCRGLGFARHGWIELKDGSIVDPTRWVFECVKPYIYIGRNDHYDAGGNVWRKQNMKPPPLYKEGDKLVEVEFDGETDGFVKTLLGYPKKITMEHMFWLANLPLEMLGTYAPSIFKTLEDVGQDSFVPIDNWRLIMGG